MYPAAMAGELRALLPRLHGRRRPTRSAAAWRSSPRRPRTSCPSRCGASRWSASSAATPARSRTARRRSAPLRELPYLGVDMLAPMPYVAVQQLLDPPNPKGMQNYWTADFFAELPDEAIDVLVEHGHQAGVAADPDHPRARRRRDLPGRRGRHGLRAAPARRGTSTTCRCGPTRPTPRRTSPTPATLAAAMKPWTTGRAYLNFIGDEGAGRVEAAFGPEKYARLGRAQARRGTRPTCSATTRTSVPPTPTDRPRVPVRVQGDPSRAPRDRSPQNGFGEGRARRRGRPLGGPRARRPGRRWRRPGGSTRRGGRRRRGRTGRRAPG